MYVDPHSGQVMSYQLGMTTPIVRLNTPQLQTQIMVILHGYDK